MFRLGGNTDQGIMSGVVPRQGYDSGELVKKAQEDKALLQKLVGKPSRGYTPAQGLIDWGLHMASATPSGSILNTAADAAKVPFDKYQASKAQRGAFDQQLGLSAAQSAIAHRDRMKELALKGQTTDLLTEQKRARIMWNTRRSDTNPNGSFNTDTGEDWTSYEEVEAFVVEKAIKSKHGEHTSKVEKDIAINEQKEFIMENIVDNPVDAEAVAEIGWLVQNDENYKDIKNKFDFNQYIVMPEDFGKKLPATETGGATQYQANLGTDSPDYQHGKIYHNMQDNRFYMFNQAGEQGSFILITMTQE